MNNKLFKAALFDLDGVVFDTEPQYTAFWGAQCREYHPEHPGLEKEIKGQTLVQIFDRYFNGPLEAARPVVNERLNKFEREMTFTYIAGLQKFLTSLRAEGIKTAVVTSSARKKMDAVEAKRPELPELFDVILTAENFERSKPDPDCYQKGAAVFGCTKDECVVFEDSFNGLRSGRAAGMAVVGLATTNPADAIAPYADVVIKDYTAFTPADCERLLEQRAAGAKA